MGSNAKIMRAADVRPGHIIDGAFFDMPDMKAEIETVAHTSYKMGGSTKVVLKGTVWDAGAGWDVKTDRLDAAYLIPTLGYDLVDSAPCAFKELAERLEDLVPADGFGIPLRHIRFEAGHMSFTTARNLLVHPGLRRDTFNLAWYPRTQPDVITRIGVVPHEVESDELNTLLEAFWETMP